MLILPCAVVFSLQFSHHIVELMILPLSVLNEISRFRRSNVVIDAVFVGDGGVIMITFESFGPQLLAMKEYLNATLSPSSSSRSMLPKTVLGAVSTGCLSIQQQQYILRLTHKYSDIIRTLPPSSRTLSIGTVSIVGYNGRSLEHRFLEIPIPLVDVDDGDDGDDSKHREFVMNSLNTVPDLSSSSRTVESYYDHHHHGVSLVSLISLPGEILGILERFKDELNVDLSDKYCWFSNDSRHLTIRTLNN